VVSTPRHKDRRQYNEDQSSQVADGIQPAGKRTCPLRAAVTILAAAARLITILAFLLHGGDPNDRA
jgi:hypothetical protein